MCTSQAGGILDSFGDTWWNITQQIFIADVTSLVNRGIIFTLPESITAIPTLYAGTYLGEHMLIHSTWRWGFGIFTILVTATVLPVMTIFWWNRRTVKKAGLMPAPKEEKAQPWHQTERRQRSHLFCVHSNALVTHL